MEYLVLTGFTMLILMVLLVAAYNRVSSSEKQIGIDTAERAVSRIKEAADFVYIHGHPTKLTITVYFPGDVEEGHSFMDNGTINLAVDVLGSHTDVWKSTRGEVEWDIYGNSAGFPTQEGYYVLKVESTDYDSIYNGSVNIYQ